MREKKFVNQFNEMVALINKNNNAAAVKNDKRVKEAFDDLSEAFGLSHDIVALLVWALNNMDGEAVDLSDVASKIDYPERSVQFALNELEALRYMEIVGENEGDVVLGITENAKSRIINHYCFFKLFNS